jgi:hypothetical protein
MARAFEKGKITFTPEWHVGGHKTEKQPTAVFRTGSLNCVEKGIGAFVAKGKSQNKKIYWEFLFLRLFTIGTFDQSNLSA